MARITLNVKPSKLQQLLNYLKRLDYVKVEDKKKDFVVPEWHKEIVKERLRNFKLEDCIEWSAVEKQLRKEYGL